MTVRRPQYPRQVDRGGRPTSRLVRRASPYVLASLLSFAFTAACGDADSGPSADSQPSEASIGVDATFQLDFAGTPDAAGPDPVMAARADGSRIAVSALPQPSGILIFDEEGQFLESVGRQGMGPGELGRVTALAFDAADSLWVFGSGRVDVFDPEFEFARSISVQMTVGNAAMTRDGSGAFLAGAPDASEIRVRVRQLSPEGELTPLEQESGAHVAGEIGSEYRALAASEEGYWVANFHEWDIRHLNLAGDTLTRVADTPDWWEPFDDSELEEFIDNSPAILGINVDGDGRLWVVAGVPVPDRDAFEALLQGEAGPEVSISFADHVIRTYDASTTELLGEQRFDYLPLKFLNRHLAAAATPQGDSVVVTIYRLGELQ